MYTKKLDKLVSGNRLHRYILIPPARDSCCLLDLLVHVLMVHTAICKCDAVRASMCLACSVNETIDYLARITADVYQFADTFLMVGQQTKGLATRLTYCKDLIAIASL